jgi:hypothetical protein
MARTRIWRSSFAARRHTQDGYLFLADVPGLAEKDVDVT